MGRDTDLVPQAMVVMGCAYPESVLFRAALEAGYGVKSEEKAQELFQIYKGSGYLALPSYAKNLCLRVTGGQNAGFTRKSA